MKFITAIAMLVLMLGFASMPLNLEAAAGRIGWTRVCKVVYGAQGSRSVEARFTWSRGSQSDVIEQWLDLSTAGADWAPGTFISKGPLPSTATAAIWEGLLPGTVHYVRVNQLRADGTWDPSPTFNFNTDCTEEDIQNTAAGLQKPQLLVTSFQGYTSNAADARTESARPETTFRVCLTRPVYGIGFYTNVGALLENTPQVVTAAWYINNSPTPVEQNVYTVNGMAPLRIPLTPRPVITDGDYVLRVSTPDGVVAEGRITLAPNTGCG